MGETESVSEDELPLDSEKKKKSGTKALSKTPEKKTKTEGTSKLRRKKKLKHVYIVQNSLHRLQSVSSIFRFQINAN